ncbi:hypothetical protein VNO80_08350 [Phaseolus coccineus]|uniref:Uncharacterized protein n=1 Tax=Phaseolus coccineus TaxID=3886 RepID=A0AAN9NLD4_PHACN
MRFLEAVLEVSGDPHGGEWALSRQKSLRIEHGSALGIFLGTIRKEGGRDLGKVRPIKRETVRFETPIRVRVLNVEAEQKQKEREKQWR